MLKRIFILLLLTVIYSSSVLLCQENDSIKSYSLNDVVVVASRFASSVKNIPTRVEIIDADKIKKSNGNRLPDIIKNSSSVFVKSYGLTPSLQTISFNGLGAEHTMVLIDGVKLNSFQNALVDLSLISLENISRIEILNNGGSSIYGSDAIGGIINIISNDDGTNKQVNDFHTNALVSGGSFNTYRYSLSINKRFDSFGLKIFFNKEKSDGNFRYFFNNGINKTEKERDNAGYSIYDAGINSWFIFDEKNRLRFISAFSLQDKDVPGIETGTPSAATNQKDKNWNNIIISENKLSSSLSLTTNFNYQNNLMNYDVEPITHSYYKNLVYSFTPELKWIDGENNYVIGYDYSHGNLSSNELENKASRNQHALFLSTGLLAVKGLRIFPSARYDHFSDINKNVVTYKIGFNYQPFEEINLSIKTNAGKNFRAPTFNDLYWKESGNKNLKPETAYNAEAGLIYLFDFISQGQIEFTYTHISAKDKIVWTPQRNLIWTPLNIAKSESNNFLINFSFAKDFADQLSVKFESGINFVNSVKTSESYSNDPTKDKNFPYIPLQTIKLGFMLEYQFFWLNLFYTHIGKRYSDFENKNSLNPYNILDGNISFNTEISGIDSELKLEVNNLTDTEYETISGYPMPLRNFIITLSLKY